MLFIFAFWQKRIFKKLLLFMTVIPHITNIFLERLYQEFDGIKENPFLFQKKYRDTRVRYVKGFPFGIYYVVDEKVDRFIILSYYLRYSFTDTAYRFFNFFKRGGIGYANVVWASKGIASNGCYMGFFQKIHGKVRSVFNHGTV